MPILFHSADSSAFMSSKYFDDVDDPHRWPWPSRRQHVLHGRHHAAQVLLRLLPGRAVNFSRPYATTQRQAHFETICSLNTYRGNNYQPRSVFPVVQQDQPEQQI